MKFSVLLILVSLSSTALAQVPEKDYPSNRLRCQLFQLEPHSSTDSLRLPFSRIRLLDVRADTSKYGYFRTGMDPAQYKYCFRGGASYELTRFMNTSLAPNLDSTNPGQVLMCLRRLWITRNDTTLKKEGITKNKVSALLKAEFYLYSNNAYHPLFRIDTAVWRESQKKVNAEGLVEEALGITLERLKKIDYVRAASARTITQEQLDEYYAQAYNIPALTAPQIPKGVYKTFAEFKTGQPSDTSFEIKFEALSDHLYLRDKSGYQYLERNVWGISDGKNVFIKLNDNFYQLFRQQSTWELYAINRTEKFKSIMPGPLARAAMPQTAFITLGVLDVLNMANFSARKINAYQLDMETGKIF